MPTALGPARAVALLLALLLLGGCQPVDPDLPDEDGAVGEADETPPPGAPPGSSALPEDLSALLAQHASSAAEWQQGAVPVEVIAGLEDGRWVSARITYLAPDADRFLVITTGPEGTSQERPTLETLGLQPIGPEGMAEVPPLPGRARHPERLAEDAAQALEDCDIDDRPTRVLYLTGAPASWDGDRWTEPLGWTATISTDDGEGAVVDPVTAAPVGRGCVAAG